MVADTDAGAHPRSRGENCDLVRDLRGWSGSSPLTRGKLLPRTAVLALHRLIPAHAGKTREFATDTNRDRAHPRSRGENVADMEPADYDAGSSPLTRGKPL